MVVSLKPLLGVVSAAARALWCSLAEWNGIAFLCTFEERRLLAMGFWLYQPITLVNRTSIGSKLGTKAALCRRAPLQTKFRNLQVLWLPQFCLPTEGNKTWNHWEYRINGHPLLYSVFHGKASSSYSCHYNRSFYGSELGRAAPATGRKIYP